MDRAALALTLASMAVTDETGRVYTGKAAWTRMESERDFYRREVVRLDGLRREVEAQRDALQAEKNEDDRMDALRATRQAAWDAGVEQERRDAEIMRGMP